MLENQFIQVKYTRSEVIGATNKAAMVVPIDAGDSYCRVGMFIIPDDGYDLNAVELVNEYDEFLFGEQLQGSQTFFMLFGQGELFGDADQLLDDGERFFIRIDVRNIETGVHKYLYSQPLVKVSPKDVQMVLLRYSCDEDTFGFPFRSAGGVYASQPVPLNLYAPQNSQDDKTYVKANGKVVTLYAKYFKEWEVETDYLSEEMHDKIVAALSCDEVFINGKRVTKSDNYQVDWENYDLDCDGVTKLARATFKVRENTNQRNSNY